MFMRNSEMGRLLYRPHACMYERKPKRFPDQQLCSNPIAGGFKSLLPPLVEAIEENGER